jgi:hypothetical protein
MIWHNGWVHFQGQWFAPTGFSIPNQQNQKGKGKGKGKGNGKGKGKGDFQNPSRTYQVPNYAPAQQTHPQPGAHPPGGGGGYGPPSQALEGPGLGPDRGQPWRYSTDPLGGG